MIRTPPDVHDSLLSTSRQNRLGNLGEQLAIERLQAKGFDNVYNMNTLKKNNIYADIWAQREGVSYIINVKTRNRYINNKNDKEPSVPKENNYYNLIDISKNNKLSLVVGLTKIQKTELLHRELDKIGEYYGAVPAWVAISVDVDNKKYSAYFGLASILRHRRSIPMRAEDCVKYEKLAEDMEDIRIISDLSNY